MPWKAPASRRKRCSHPPKALSPAPLGTGSKDHRRPPRWRRRHTRRPSRVERARRHVRSERDPRPPLKRPRAAGTEDIAEPAAGLAETRRQQVVHVPAEVRRVQHIEYFAEHLPFQPLAEAKDLGHAQVLRVEY